MSNYNDKILGVYQGAGFMAVECLTGIYKAFEEAGIIPGKIMSSSGGTLFSSLYYSIGNAQWFEDLANQSPPSDFIDLEILQAAKLVVNKSNYVFDNTKVYDLLKEHMTGEASKRVTTSVTCNTDWTSHMRAVTPGWAMAATSIPFVFMPVQIGDHLWSDGGLLNNIPTPSIEDAANYDHIFLFLAPPTKLEGSNIFLIELVNLLQAVMEREYSQLKDSGFLELPNVTVLQAEESYGGSVLSWSNDFKLREVYYELTKEKLKNVEI